MLQDLLYILIAGVCGCMLLFVSQQGLLRSITICAALGVTFAGLLTKACNAPTSLVIGAALAITTLLVWLGRAEHIEPLADQDTAADQAQEPYTGLLHPTVTEALRQRMATSE